MYEGQLIFTQVMTFMPRNVFDAAVERHRGNYNSKGITCRDQLLAMVYAQLTCMDGLTGIVESLDVNRHCLYHMGFRCGVLSKSTLAHVNKTKPWPIYADLAVALMKIARELYAGEPLSIDLDATVFALDSTTIDLCLSQFLWTPSQQSKAAAKMHVLLELHGDIPDFIVISNGKTHDVNILDQVVYVVGAYYIMDRGYVDFDRLYRLHQSLAFFVTRAKKNMKFEAVKSHDVDKSTGLICDQTIRLTSRKSRKNYPEYLRRVKYRDPETGKVLVFLTNNFSLPALTIAALYKQRWQVELFFKWIKQHLRIKKFYGYSENAVRTQLWIAVATYCLLAIIKKKLNADRDLHEIQEILRVSLFQKMPLLQAFSKESPKSIEDGNHNLMPLFEL